MDPADCANAIRNRTMIPSPEILRAIILERPVTSLEILDPDFYSPCIDELMRSELFECIPFDTMEGNTFYSYLLFPRDTRSLWQKEGNYKGEGIALNLSMWYPIAAYGKASVDSTSHFYSASSLSPEKLQTLPDPSWTDVEQFLVEILSRHSIGILSSEEGATHLSSIGLPALGPEWLDNSDSVYSALFNNDY